MIRHPRSFRTLVACSVLAAIAVSSGSCTSSRKKPSRATQVGDFSSSLTGQEAADYREIQKLFANGSYESLIVKLGNFEKKYPRSKQMAHAYNLHGLALLATKRAGQATAYFNRSIDKSNHPEFRQFVMYNLAVAQMEGGQFEDSQQTLTIMRPELLDRDTQVKFHILRSRLLLKRGIPNEAARAALAPTRLLEDEQTRPLFASQLEQVLQNVSDLAALEALYRDFEYAPIADVILFRLGSMEITQGRAGLGEGHLRLLMERYPSSAHYAEAQELLKSFQTQSGMDSRVVGVLLPMKGKYAKFGQQSLQAIQLALRIFNLDEPDSKISLVIEDSGDEPEQALRALNNLYFKHRVAAVIGPLLSKGIDNLTRRAEELGLPLLTLAQQPGTPGQYVFPLGLTPQAQASEIARYAVENLGLKRFAILYPRDKFGEQFSQHYWDAIERNGGQVVGVESYASGETDFRHVIDRLSGLYYEEARKREVEALTKEREANNITKRNRKTEQFFALKPIIDYDAVFIPDEPKVVGQILPTFAYRDVDGVRFLGISTWHSPELLTRAQNYANGAMFVDAFFRESSQPVVKNFVARYRATYGQEPTAIEALAFDAASILEPVINSGPKSRSEVRDRLKTLNGFPGVTGRITYRDNAFQRNLNVLQIQNGQFIEVR